MTLLWPGCDSTLSILPPFESAVTYHMYRCNYGMPAAACHYRSCGTSTGKPSERGPSVPVDIRLAVGLRILAGGSHLDVCVVFGLPNSAAEPMVGQVVDAINSREEIGASFLPRIKALCERYAKRFEVRAHIVYEHIYANILLTSYRSDISDISCRSLPVDDDVRRYFKADLFPILHGLGLCCLNGTRPICIFF